LTDSVSSLLREVFSNAETRLKQLEHHPNRTAWLRILQSLQRMGSLELSRLDAKILAATLEDLEQGFAAFQNYAHQRKITVFGSARLGPESPEYRQAQLFAYCISQRGFMVMTGDKISFFGFMKYAFVYMLITIIICNIWLLIFY